jgi:hypothetical protein
MWSLRAERDNPHIEETTKNRSDPTSSIPAAAVAGRLGRVWLGDMGVGTRRAAEDLSQVASSTLGA